jgi:3-oxoadipate enol-lactonase
VSFDINYREAGTGTPIVFLHGMGGDAASWEFQLEAFAPTHRAIAMDMPGYGGSAAIMPMSFAGLAEATVQLLDHLQIEDAHLVGLSMGGMVVQEVAATYPKRVRSLVLSATSPAFGPPDGDFQQQFVTARLKPLESGKGMAELAATGIPRMFGPNANPKGVETATASMAATPEATYRASVNCLITFDRREALGKIDVPTLVLAGELDDNAPAPMMERMAGRITGATYVCLPAAGHLANQEFPDLYNRALSNFYSQIEEAT